MENEIKREKGNEGKENIKFLFKGKIIIIKKYK